MTTFKTYLTESSYPQLDAARMNEKNAAVHKTHAMDHFAKAMACDSGSCKYHEHMKAHHDHMGSHHVYLGMHKIADQHFALADMHDKEGSRGNT